MGSRTGVEARLRKAADLGAVLAVAYEAFEGMLSLLRQHQDRAGELFAIFVMAAASAADGRDAVAAAPSLPRCRKRTEQLTPPTARDADAGRVADELAALSQLLAARLADFGQRAPQEGDRAASAEAASAAEKINNLVSGTG